MALTNEIKTRILLRYDSLTNWTATDPVLKAGEIALVTTGPAKDTGAVTPDGGAQHPLLMKVGDGTHKFSELTWSSALAADVYAWAKQAALPVAKEGTGNVVTGIYWDTTSKGLKFTTASMATSDAFTALETRVKTIEDTYATDKELADAVAAINQAIALKADKSYVDDELAKKVNNTAFAEFQTANTTAIGTAKSEAIAAAKTETENQVKALKDAEVTTNANNITKLQTLVGGSELASGAKTVLARLGTIESDYAKTTEVTAELNKKADLDDFNTLDGKVSTLIGSDTGKSARTIANEELAAQLLHENGAVDNFKTLQELAAWLEQHPEDAAEMNTAIGNNTKAISDEVTRATGEEARIEGKLDALLSENGSVVHAVEADHAEEADHADNADHATNADNATNAANATKLGGQEANYYASAQSVTALDTKITGENGAIATAKSEAISAAATAAANAHYLKSEVYTQAEADAKFVDNDELTGAINNMAITTTAGAGLVVTDKKHIDIDRSLTFIFNCGGASVEEA